MTDKPTMTEDEAKELLIDGMNYAAYHETIHSLWDSDKNKLFGSEHYVSARPVFQPSVWGDGEDFEQKMADLLRWAIQLGRSDERYSEAIRTLLCHEHYLSRIIKRAGLEKIA
jgi:hypothetical protein